MKPKNLIQAHKQIRKIMKDITNYSYTKYIVGDIDKNVYVQFVPVMKAFFYDDSGKLVSEEMDSHDLRKLKLSPKGNDWRSQLLGIKKTEE